MGVLVEFPLHVDNFLFGFDNSFISPIISHGRASRFGKVDICLQRFFEDSVEDIVNKCS